MKNERLDVSRRREIKNIDITLILSPLVIISFLCLVFFIYPEQSKNVVDSIRRFIGNELGFYYMLLGISIFAITIYIAFSKYGKIKLGNTDKPQYSNFSWGLMIFTSTMAADILFYSLCEWALYAKEPHIEQLGGVQEWASTYSLFHWGPIPWGFYIVLAVAFGFMIHVRGTNKQKFSEACRPILKEKTDGIFGKIIDLVALIGLLAGTATTFSLATPLLLESLCTVFGIKGSVALTIALLIIIALVYTLTILFGMKGISKLASICSYFFFALVLYFLIGGGEFVYIIETGITSIGNLTQNFISLSTNMDPLRATGDGQVGFVQNWTIFYWAYWMVWCVATPFFIGMISKGRTIKNMILGGYVAGLLGTFTSFIVFGNYGMAQQMKHGMDISGSILNGTDIPTVIISIFQTLPMPQLGLILLVITMIAFYSTTFDAITMVVSYYSYKNLKPNQDPDKKVRIFWSILFILFPIALIFSENSMHSLQSVSIIAAFPIGIVIMLIIASFFKDARVYIKQNKNKIDNGES